MERCRKAASSGAPPARAAFRSDIPFSRPGAAMSPPVMPSCGLPDIHPLLNRRRPERVALQYLGPPLVAARGFAEDEPVPGRIAAVDEAVPYRIRPLDQMLEDRKSTRLNSSH